MQRANTGVSLKTTTNPQTAKPASSSSKSIVIVSRPTVPRQGLVTSEPEVEEVGGGAFIPGDSRVPSGENRLDGAESENPELRYQRVAAMEMFRRHRKLKNRLKIVFLPYLAFVIIFFMATWFQRGDSYTYYLTSSMKDKITGQPFININNQ